MVALLATPEAFDGERVRVHGYIHLEFEGNGIYLHEEDYLHQLYKNGLWVSLKRDQSFRGCQDQYVPLEGTFRAQDKGHMNLWNASITDITRCGWNGQ